VQLWGYLPSYDVPAAYASAEANQALLTGITVVRYQLGDRGDVVDYPGLPALPAWLAESGLAVSALVANDVGGRWDADIVAEVLGNADWRRRHVADLIDQSVDYAGLEIDYEGLNLATRDHFSRFIEELAAALHARGKQLAVAVHAKEAEPGDGGAQGQDWARLGAAADRVAVMTYDYDPSRPGPVSPISWTEHVLRFAISQIPAAKLIQGIPLYGYRWTQAASPSYVTHREFLDLARLHDLEPSRDPTDRHLVLSYTESGVRHEAWLPDAETASALARIGRGVGVAGYAVWRLGGEQASALPELARAGD
jgi:spore germination protein YaaH